MAVTIALHQSPIRAFESFADWENHTENLIAEAAAQNAEILVFPEYGSMELVSLFPENVQSDLAAQLHELQQLLVPFKRTFQALAAKYRCVIVAPSFPVKEAGHYCNRAFVFSEKGSSYQDKWFMTRFENETWGVSGPERRLAVFDTGKVRFGVQICYDIEFPIGSHILAENGAQLIVAPSCTETIRGAARVHIGARARALEQQIWTAVSQTVGNAPWSPAVDINYGYGGIYSSPDHGLPEEGILAESPRQEPGWLIRTPDLSLNEAARRSGQVFNYKDSRSIGMTQEKEITTVLVRL
jgi:predicted amidohydrolase